MKLNWARSYQIQLSNGQTIDNDDIMAEFGMKAYTYNGKLRIPVEVVKRRFEEKLSKQQGKQTEARKQRIMTHSAVQTHIRKQQIIMHPNVQAHFKKQKLLNTFKKSAPRQEGLLGRLARMFKKKQ